MIIEIDDNLLHKVTDLMKNRNTAIYEQLLKIKPIENISTNSLQQAREIKTLRVKQSIKETINELLNANIKITKYQVHKRTGIAYVTINKYYDEILDEVKKVG